MKRLMVFLLAFIITVPNVLFSQDVNDSTKVSFKPDSTNFLPDVHHLSAPLLRDLPFRGEAQEYYSLFPGLVNQDYRGADYLHVRGSRHDEVSYAVEGIDIRSAYSGMSLFPIILEALQSITMQTSPLASADNSSALIQHRLRRGGEHYHFTLQGESDRFTSDYQSQFGTYSYGYGNVLMTAEGKLLSGNTRFFVAGEYRRFNDRYRRFWDGFSIGEPEISFFDEGKQMSLQEMVGVDRIEIRPGNIQHANSNRFTGNAVLSADLQPFQFQLIGLYNWEKEQQNDTPIVNLFDPARIPETKNKAGLLSLQTDYFGRNQVRAHLQLDFLRSQSKTYDPLFEDDFLLYRDSTAIVEKGVNWSVYPGQNVYYDSYIEGPGSLNFFNFDFRAPGELLTSYSKVNENYWAISGWLQKQYGSHHIKAGGQYQRRTIRKFAIGNLRDYMYYFRDFDSEPADLDENQMLLLRNEGEVYAYGYDIFGKEIESGDLVFDEVNEGARHPVNYSLYVEDRYDMKKVSINLGLRYAGIASDAKTFENPQIPGSTYFNIKNSELKTAPVHHFWLPRLNMVFQLNSKIDLHFDYGKFVQQARLSDIYVSRTYLSNDIWNGFYTDDHRGPDAEPIQWTQVQAGLSYRILPNLQLESSVYHKVTDGQLQIDRIQIRPPFTYMDYYDVLKNNGESIAKGLEFILHYRRGNLNVWTNYTWSDVTGDYSYPESNLMYFDYDELKAADHLSNLEFNQTHQVNALFSYRFDSRAPFWIRNTGFYTLFRFNSGHSFTLYDGGFG